MVFNVFFLAQIEEITMQNMSLIHLRRIILNINEHHTDFAGYVALLNCIMRGAPLEKIKICGFRISLDIILFLNNLLELRGLFGACISLIPDPTT